MNGTDKRIRQCRQEVVEALNRAKLPLAVLELILENMLQEVTAKMAAEKEDDDGEQKQA